MTLANAPMLILTFTVWTVIGVLTPTSRADTNETCERLVAVLPWLHPVGETSSDLAKAINRSALFASRTDCGFAEKELAQNLAKLHGTYNNAHEVIIRLEEIYRTSKFNVIGTELPQKDAVQQFSNFGLWESQFNIISKTCPSANVRDLVAKYRLMYFGPEYTFSKSSHRGVSVVGVEDEEPFRQTGTVLNELAKVSLDTTQLLPVSQKLIEELNPRVANGEMTDVTLLKRVRGLEKNTPAVASLDKAILLLEQRDELVLERNAAIVRRLLDQPQRYVVVIGKFHEPDLSTRFRSECTGQPSHAPTTVAPPASSTKLNQ